MNEAKKTVDEMTHHASKGGTSTLLVVVIVFTIIALILGGIYMSGAADDVVEYFAKQFFKAKAKAEEKALEHAGSEKAQGFLKDQLKKNPVVPAGELNEIQSGLGDEAVKEFGRGGIGKGLGGLMGK